MHLLLLLLLLPPACSSHLSVYPIRVPTIGPSTNITVNLLGTHAVPSGTTSATCKIEPPAAGSTHILNATVSSFPAEIISNTQVICHGVPNVVAPGPGILVVAFHHQNITTKSLSANITYFNPVDFAVSKRPYIYETSGDILLRFDKKYFRAEEQFKVTAKLPAAGPSAKWEWDVTISSSTTFPNVILPLSFISTLPPNTKSIHNDISVTVTCVSDGANYVRSRRFHRVPPPPENSTVIPVQVDHTKRSLLVNGTTFQMQGFYMGTDHPTNASFWLQEELNLITQKLVPNGLNIGLLYDLQNEPLDVQRNFLDGCHQAGFKILYPLSMFSKVNINHGGPFNQPALLKDLIANITFVRDHPAIFGYEICDDCCSTISDISKQAQVYQLIKNLDPYHVTVGAANCGDSWMFSDVTPSWLTPEKNILSMQNIPEAIQPNLQLSLDVIMQENYNYMLSIHDGNGTWKGGVGSDGFFRHGIEFEPLTNCPGTWLAKYYTDLNVQFLSAQWLGLVTADMHDSLAFVMTPAYEYLIPQSGLFSQRVSLLENALMAPFGSVQHPLVYPSGSSSSGEGLDSSNVRSRGWLVPKESRDTQICLGYVVVVNINETNAVHFEVTIVDVEQEQEEHEQQQRGEKSDLLPCNAIRMFDNETAAVVRVGKDGALADHAQPAGTNVYCLVH